ncbi:hypothetical protein ABDK00_008560 [Niabella insulamsoli]|uniref:hypothetical protein n=1 Tax=Niabella insulamsoli TaxID=3144874 RepID=UPI0031FBC8DF
MERDFAKMTDQELLEEERKLKSFSVLNAFLIGALIGVIMFSVFYSAYGIALLIPLFLIYKLGRDPRNKEFEKLKATLKERHLR